ncbi:hypothetical protein [Vannielia sp. SX4]|uniref:hypothetical protein n=1 Tax=Vannielia sp. SX4 TaxID=3463852 RepID=UPI00405930E7
MNLGRLIAAATVLCCPVPLTAQSSVAVLENCTFDILRSSEGVMTLADFMYRVRWSNRGLWLEHLMSDGIWHPIGPVELRSSANYRTYLAVHEGEVNTGVTLLSITERGGAVLLVHHIYGWGAIGARGGAIFQGTCERQK